jgi:hypothetical protein
MELLKWCLLGIAGGEPHRPLFSAINPIATNAAITKVTMVTTSHRALSTPARALIHRVHRSPEHDKGEQIPHRLAAKP